MERQKNTIKAQQQFHICHCLYKAIFSIYHRHKKRLHPLLSDGLTERMWGKHLHRGTSLLKTVIYTACPKSVDQFVKVTYYMK